MHQQRFAKIVDRPHKFVSASLLIGFSQQPPFRAREVESEVYKLSWQLCLLLLYLRVGRRQAKGASCSAALIVVGSHFFLALEFELRIECASLRKVPR